MAFSNQVEYACEQDFQPTSKMSAECQDDGEWMPPLPQCTGNTRTVGAGGEWEMMMLCLGDAMFEN